MKISEEKIEEARSDIGNEEKFEKALSDIGNDEKFEEALSDIINEEKFEKARDDIGNEEKFEKARADIGNEEKFGKARPDIGNEEKFEKARPDIGNEEKFEKRRSDIGNEEKIEKALPDIGNEEKKIPKTSMTPRKIRVLTAVVFGNLFLGSCYSLMAPFFPAEAERKQASPTSYGLVFGIYQLAMFLSSPVYGKIIPKLRPAFMMKAGMLVSGVCGILFGLLEFAPPGPSFICLAALIRFIDALGAAAFLTASYTTLGSELADVVGRAMSITETAFALGLAGGPVLGGILYEIGGYRLPFIGIGSLLLAGTVINCFLFVDDGTDIPRQTIKAFDLLSDIDFLIDVLSMSTTFACLSFTEASLEPHIRQFGLSPTITGTIFLITGITDAVFSPLWGYFAEKVSNAQYLTLLGALLFIACFLIIGPVSFLNFPTTFWVVILALFLMGLGMASEIVCSFTHGMKHTIERGFPNEVGTYSLISGLLFSCGCFGAFVGPSLGGYLIDEFGYISTTEIVVGMKSFVALVCAGRLIYLYFKRTKKT